MLRPTLGQTLLTTFASRGIPSVALILGATSCQDDPVYFYPEDDASADTGGGGESDTGGGGESDTGGGDSDTGTAGDTGIGDTNDAGDTGHEPTLAETVLRRFCERSLACEQGSEPSLLSVLACAGGMAYRLEYFTDRDPENGVACTQAYLEIYSDLSNAECIEVPFTNYYGEEDSYTHLVLNPLPEIRYQTMAICVGVDAQALPILLEACQAYIACEGGVELQDCMSDAIENVANSEAWMSYYECAVLEGVCNAGTFVTDPCVQPPPY